jgi:hypothetical protein
MKPVLWLAGISAVSAALLGAAFGREVWVGMLAPLFAACGTWALTERVHRANPGQVTAVMIGAFAGKLVFFGGYVALAIGVLGMHATPFAVSFAGYFIALHVIEAYWLRRLFVSSH